MSVPSNRDNSDGKRRKIKEIIITYDYEEIRKLYRKAVARSNNFDSLREAIVRAIYGGEWHISLEHYLRNEEEVVLNILELIAEEADVILSIIPLRKTVPVLSKRFELKEKYQGKREEIFKRERETWK